jgi:hypothetical protein
VRLVHDKLVSCFVQVGKEYEIIKLDEVIYTCPPILWKYAEKQCKFDVI